jgi:hypothetical protein
MYKHDIEMPKTYRDVLLKIVENAKNKKTMTGVCVLCSDTWYISLENSYYYRNKQCLEFSDIIGDPFVSFDCMGYLRIIENGSYEVSGKASGPGVRFFISPDAFEWAEYQKKNSLRKYMTRHPNSLKNVMIGFSFLVSLFVFLFQLFGYLKTIPAISPYIPWLPTQTPVP